MEKKIYTDEKLSCFNYIVTYYRAALKLANLLKPHQMRCFSKEVKNISIIFNRLMINSIGVNIAQNFDYIERHKSQNIDDIILEELDSFCEMTNDENEKKFRENFVLSLKKIMKDNNLTPFETLKQIRNSLLHGNYSINMSLIPDKSKMDIEYNEVYGRILKYKDRVDTEIKMQSKKMQGTLPFKETVVYLDELFYNIKTEGTSGLKEFTEMNRRYVSCKNEEFLKKYIEGIQSYYIIPRKTKEESNTDEYISKFPNLGKYLERIKKLNNTDYFEIQKIPEKEMNQRRKDIENYIRYIGKNNWEEYCTLRKNKFLEQLYEDIFQIRFGSNYATKSLSRDFFILLQDLFESDNNIIQSNNEDLAEELAFKAPLIYTDLMLGLLNYACVYLKANSSEENNLFEYHNLNGMKGVVPLIDNDKTKSIRHGLSGEEKQRKIDLALDNYKIQLKRVKESIRKTKNQLNSLSEKNPNRAQMEYEFKNSIVENKAKLEDIMDKVFKLSIRKKEYSDDYTDYSELFRHFRNSIAHGTYEIDFDRALRCKNLEKIQFTFYDYKEEDIERKNPVFKIKLKASKIEEIIINLQNRVNDQLKRENQIKKLLKTKLDVIIQDSEIENDELGEH